MRWRVGVGRPRVFSTGGATRGVSRDDPEQFGGVREGDILAGKYRVERVLGAGGMGVVVAAHHVDLDERMAIKFLLPEMLADADAVSRFAREARAAVKIKSEHVARVFDVGTLETGAPYMVMEFLEGGDLAAWLRQRGAMPVEQAVEFVLQACVAVAEAHSLGIVHRDLKPANLFCVRGADGRLFIKVIDFGISKLTTFNAPGAGAMTKTSAIMGSPLYMSPEQMQSSRDVDARTDIWALGVVLYEFLSGRVPFTGNTMAEIIIQVATHSPASVRALRPDLPKGLEGVVHRCLEKDRGRRYRHIGELAVALLPYAPRTAAADVEKIAGIVQARAFPAPVPSAPPPDAHRAGEGTATATSLGRTTAGPRRSSGRWLVLGGAVVVGVAAAGAVVARRVREEDATVRDTPPATAQAGGPSSAAVLPPSSTPASIPAEAPVVTSMAGYDAGVVAPAASANSEKRATGHTAVPSAPRAAVGGAAAPPPPGPPPSPPSPNVDPLFDLKPK